LLNVGMFFGVVVGKQSWPVTEEWESWRQEEECWVCSRRVETDCCQISGLSRCQHSLCNVVQQLLLFSYFVGQYRFRGQPWLSS